MYKILLLIKELELLSRISYNKVRSKSQGPKLRLASFIAIVLLSGYEIHAGVSEQWVDFKQSLLQTYLPKDQSMLNAMWADSVDLRDINSRNSTYIRKYGANRIVTHYFLSQTIQRKNLSRIKLATKKIVILNENNREASLGLTLSMLQDEAFLQKEFLSTFEFYTKQKLPESERISTQGTKYSNYSVLVLAQRVAFRPIDKDFATIHWQQLRDLVIATPFDLGQPLALGQPPDYNFGLTHKNDIIIFDTEPGAYRDGRDSMYNFATHHSWVSGQELVLEIVNSDISHWPEEKKQEEIEKQQRKDLEKKVLEEQEKQRKEEELYKRITQKKITDSPNFSHNALGNLVGFLKEGDCVVIRSDGEDQVFYLKGLTQDPNKIRFIIVDVSATSLASPNEWPWHINNHFKEKLDNNFWSIYENFINKTGNENGNIFLSRMPGFQH